ncbi:MAG TPA: M17 family peptidase N-terminal domain-containing protein [Actinoplanes sp.]|nr:M17 family peptidase N-terminal domain-containing protein [Actinoplanes sp.]
MSAATIDVTPSLGRLADLRISVETAVEPGAAEAIAELVTADGPVPAGLGVDRAELAACGFEGRVGQWLLLPAGQQPVRVAVGVGDVEGVSATEVRDAAATFSRAVPHLTRLAVRVPGFAGVPAGPATEAAVEGMVLGRYHFHVTIIS